MARDAEVAVRQVEGGQVCDLFAFDASDPDEYLSVGHTRVSCERLFPRVGQSFVTNRRPPILTLLADSTNGRHDTLFAACDPVRYELLGHKGHRSCAANLRNACAELGRVPPIVPQPVNLFMYVAVGGDGSLEARPSEASAGQGVRLRCETDVLLAVSACPQDLTPINGGALSALLIEISSPQQAKVV